MGPTLHVNRSQHHLHWNRDQPPGVIIDSGDTVTVDTVDGGNGQIRPDSTAEVLTGLDMGQMDPAFGPVYVRGAEPGDALRVDILDLQVGHWGWTAIVPGFGILAEEYREPALKIWHFAPTDHYATFKPGIRIPIRPFLGVMGVAPAEAGAFSTLVPLSTGGNIDCRHLTVGATLYLPVRTRGALFSCGDGHAAQGDGEVCGSAIETSIKATLRLTVDKHHGWIEAPQLTHSLPVSAPAARDGSPARYHSALGIDASPLEATKKAVRGIVQYLQRIKGLDRVEAYMLASVAVDLKMAEVVDMPNFAIAATLPLDIFVDDAV